MGIITLAIKHGDTVQEDVFQFTDDQIKAFAAELVADQVAEIARLQKELEEARKDAERWNAILHSGAYSPSDFGNPIGFAGRTGQYTKEQLNASADAYIAKHCAAAISKIGGGE